MRFLARVSTSPPRRPSLPPSSARSPLPRLRQNHRKPQSALPTPTSALRTNHVTHRRSHTKTTTNAWATTTKPTKITTRITHKKHPHIAQEHNLTPTHLPFCTMSLIFDGPSRHRHEQAQSSKRPTQTVATPLGHQFSPYDSNGEYQGTGLPQPDLALPTTYLGKPTTEDQNST